MDELFRMMTVRAPQVTTDPNVVTIAPRQFRAPPPPIDQQYEQFLQANAYQDIADLDLSRSGTLALFPSMKSLVDQIVDGNYGSLDPDAFKKSVQAIFGKTADALSKSNDFQSLGYAIADSIVALLIGAKKAAGVAVPPAISHKIADAISFARVMSLIQRIGTNNATDPFKTAADIQRALLAPVLLPGLIFPLINLQDLSIQAFGYADLLVVKEHIIGYELGEIARIENILRGETNRHRYEHGLTTNNTTVTTTATTTEDTTELDQTEHLALHNETANTIQEDLSAKGDVHLSYSGVVNFSANAEVAWSQSKNTATKASSDYAKDVTTRASNKVTRQFSQQVTQQITEILKDVETHGLSNTGQDHIRGVYQWITAVYEAEIFSYGNRILLDMLIPEPGAFLRSVAIQENASAVPSPPSTIDFRPDEILDKLPDPNDYKTDADYQTALKTALPKYYGTLVNSWGLTDFEAPPEEQLVLTKVITGTQSKSGGTTGAQTVDMKLKPGFYAARGRISATFQNTDNQDSDYSLSVAVGAIDPSLRTISVLTEYAPTHRSSVPTAVQRPNRVQGITDGMVVFSYLGNGTFFTKQNPNLEKPAIIFGTVSFLLGYKAKQIFVPAKGSTPVSALPQEYYDNKGPLTTPPEDSAITPVDDVTFFPETDSVSVAAFPSLADGASFSLHVEISCERSPKALADWQTKLYGKIQTAYQKQLQDYNSKVATVGFPTGISSNTANLGGSSADENRNTERTELKKSCIQALMTPWQQMLDYNNVHASLPEEVPVAGVALPAPQIDMPEDGFDTIATTVTLSGTGSPGAQLTVCDGSISFGPFAVKADGSWQAESPVSLVYGTHVLVATQVKDFRASPPSKPASGVVRPAAAPFGVELPYPQPKFPLDAEYARAVRFFEQAFEWENISSFLYPYYWGRKETWYDLTKFISEDALHQRFIRAGAARVVVPVRPSMNPDVLFYLITGKLFITGDVPQFGEPDYFPITDEIRADSDALYDPVPIPDQPPWEVRVPTKFLWLRKNDKKPAWQLHGVKNWSPPESPNWSWENNLNDPFDDGE